MIDVTKLTYNVIPAQVSGHPELISRHNQVYGFWQNIWSSTLAKLDLPPLDRSHIFQQDYLCYLTDQDKVVAAHLYTVFDVRCQAARDTESLQQLATELTNYCQTEQINTLMSMEYLAVDPQWRKLNSGVSLPEIVIGLGIKMMFSINCQSIIGTIREGAPSVERICRDINADMLSTVISKYKMPHKFFIAGEGKVQLPGTPETQTAIERLWLNRFDYRLTPQTQAPTIAA